MRGVDNSQYYCAKQTTLTILLCQANHDATHHDTTNRKRRYLHVLRLVEPCYERRTEAPAPSGSGNLPSSEKKSPHCTWRQFWLTAACLPTETDMPYTLESTKIHQKTNRIIIKENHSDGFEMITIRMMLSDGVNSVKSSINILCCISDYVYLGFNLRLSCRKLSDFRIHNILYHFIDNY